MSSLLITNGHVVTLDEASRVVPNGSVYVEDHHVVAVGALDPARYPAEHTIDARGAVVMPGLINAHHHLYSTFARGFTPPGPPARSFEENLAKLWWKLDAALDAEDVYHSALLAVMEAARAGCTTIIDHHASPSCCEGSLDQVERAFRDVGLSGCLCYEVSDRNREGEGIEENERYIRRCRASGDDQMSALVGMHAPMTLGTRTLERCARVGEDLGAGYHVHVAEDAVDVRVTRERHGQRIVDRLREFGIPGPRTLFVHGTYLEPDELDVLRSTDSVLVANPESNMNNGLRVSPMLDVLEHGVTVGLGTDGMSSHVLSQARAAYLHARTLRQDPTVGFAEACASLLEGNRTICNRLFREPRGALAPGHVADVVVQDYVPFTPFDAETFYGHLLFGLAFARVRTTIARGRVVVDEGRLPGIDEEAIRAHCVERAAAVWARIH